MNSALIPRLRAGVLVIFVLLAGGALAHEGHDHGEEKKPAGPVALTPRLEARSGPFELVALRQSGELLIYLDRFATNEPVTRAQVTVETPDGPKQAALKDGVYRLPAPWQSGSLDLIFTVVDGTAIEILSGTLKLDATVPAPDKTPASGSLWSTALAQELAQGVKERVSTGSTLLLLLAAFGAGVLVSRLLFRRPKLSVVLLLFAAILVLASPAAFAHEGEAHEQPKMAAPVPSDLAQRLPDGALFVPKPVQRLLAIRTLVTQVSTHRKTLELPGRIIPDPNASGFVQASVSGRLPAPRHHREGRRSAGLRHAPLPGDRCLGHAPKAGRAGAADRHRRDARRPLRRSRQDRRRAEGQPR
jgi:hypothetical protein